MAQLCRLVAVNERPAEGPRMRYSAPAGAGLAEKGRVVFGLTEHPDIGQDTNDSLKRPRG
jgi:hypothetical protein